MRSDLSTTRNHPAFVGLRHTEAPLLFFFKDALALFPATIPKEK
jgi:hypothetical protein